MTGRRKAAPAPLTVDTFLLARAKDRRIAASMVPEVYDSARVLKEVNAIHQIVIMYRAAKKRKGDVYVTATTAIEGVLETLAMAYNDHPQFNEKWGK